MNKPLISCENLRVTFSLPDGNADAVRGVSFSINETETLGIVGESGCGKTMTALSLLRLIPNPPGKISGGKILFNDTDLVSCPEKQIRSIRGGAISMIFQDPMTSLNPLFTCRNQIRESIFQHTTLSTSEADERINTTLSEVGIPDPHRTANSYPHQLSGGMRQRVMIAMALVCGPKLLIADEPTTALDVTVQAKILDLLHTLQEEKKMSMLLITHNLGIVGDIADNVLVMYAGEVMEYAPVATLFDRPLHPYTINLLETIPSIESKKELLTVIPGEVPTLSNFPAGCPFHPRCSKAFSRCTTEHPDLTTISADHQVRCFLYE